MLHDPESQPHADASSGDADNTPSQAELFRTGRLFIIETRVASGRWHQTGNRHTRADAERVAAIWSRESGCEYRVIGHDAPAETSPDYKPAYALADRFRGRMLAVRNLLQRKLRNAQIPFDVTIAGYGDMRIYAGSAKEAIDAGYRLFGVSDHMRPHLIASAIEAQP